MKYDTAHMSFLLLMYGVNELQLELCTYKNFIHG